MDIKNAVEMEANLFGVVNAYTRQKRRHERFLREEKRKELHRFLNRRKLHNKDTKDRLLFAGGSFTIIFK